MKLVKVDVQGWSDRGIPGVADWVNLEDLSISRCEGVARLDGVSELTRLQRLELFWSDFNDMSYLNYLTGLKCIWIRSCGLEKMPAMHNMTRLETLVVCHCSGITVAGVSGSKSPDTLEACQLSVETLDYVPLKELPGLSMFPQLIELYIDGCKELERLTSTVPMIALEELMIEYCEKLKEVPDLGLFPQLSVLGIDHCEELERLTNSAPMTALETIILTNCEKLTDVPDLRNFNRRFSFFDCGVDVTSFGTQELEAMYPGLQINEFV